MSRNKTKYLKLGDSLELTTKEDDATAAETTNILVLMRCFEIYCQIIIFLVPDTVKIPLSVAFAFYRDYLYGHARIYTWESVRTFHFTFHKSRIARGVTDPALWEEVDVRMEQLLLVRKTIANPYRGLQDGRSWGSNDFKGSSDTRPPYQNKPTINDHANSYASRTTPICRLYNNGMNCGPNCRFAHTCNKCKKEGHPAKDCKINEPGH